MNNEYWHWQFLRSPEPACKCRAKRYCGLGQEVWNQINRTERIGNYAGNEKPRVPWRPWSRAAKYSANISPLRTHAFCFTFSNNAVPFSESLTFAQDCLLSMVLRFVDLAGSKTVSQYIKSTILVIGKRRSGKQPSEDTKGQEKYQAPEK